MISFSPDGALRKDGVVVVVTIGNVVATTLATFCEDEVESTVDVPHAVSPRNIGKSKKHFLTMSVCLRKFRSPQ